MPAEWAAHRATWLSWPHNLDTWPGAMQPIPAVWGKLAAALSAAEEVHILVSPAVQRDAVWREIEAADGNRKRVTLHDIATNDAWIRDSGPIFVTHAEHGECALVDWRYNAWGGKYPPWDADDAIPIQIAEVRGCQRFVPGIVLEGGSIDVNGAGALLTTESCLLNPNRNPNLDRDGIEAALRTFLGVTHIIWLGDGIVGDDTDGHIDDLTRFVSEQTVVTVIEDDRDDANYQPLMENLWRLEHALDQDGRSLEIVTLPMPPPVFCQGERLPASYANFYIGNEVVVVPTFRCDRDDVALEILQRQFPTRRMIGIDAVDLVWGLGAFHCVTQQEPL